MNADKMQKEFQYNETAEIFIQFDNESPKKIGGLTNDNPFLLKIDNELLPKDDHTFRGIQFEDKGKTFKLFVKRNNN